eukprot:m.367803 g.367803  ORF g.367803 m.367803 type:complete len:84 (-) comp42486_c0_seq1:3-254(-)
MWRGERPATSGEQINKPRSMSTYNQASKELCCGRSARQCVRLDGDNRATKHLVASKGGCWCVTGQSLLLRTSNMESYRVGEPK